MDAKLVCQLLWALQREGWWVSRLNKYVNNFAINVNKNGRRLRFNLVFFFFALLGFFFFFFLQNQSTKHGKKFCQNINYLYNQQQQQQQQWQANCKINLCKRVQIQLCDAMSVCLSVQGGRAQGWGGLLTPFVSAYTTPHSTATHLLPLLNTRCLCCPHHVNANNKTPRPDRARAIVIIFAHKT